MDKSRHSYLGSTDAPQHRRENTRSDISGSHTSSSAHWLGRTKAYADHGGTLIFPSDPREAQTGAAAAWPGEGFATRRPAATIDRRSALNIDLMAVFQCCGGETMREGGIWSKTVSPLARSTSFATIPAAS